MLLLFVFTLYVMLLGCCCPVNQWSSLTALVYSSTRTSRLSKNSQSVARRCNIQPLVRFKWYNYRQLLNTFT